MDNPSGPGVWERRAPYFFVGPSFRGQRPASACGAGPNPAQSAFRQDDSRGHPRERDELAHPQWRRGESPRVLANLLGSQNANCR